MPICIAGMHRSGTSMVARLLNLCGVSLGDEDDLMVASPANPEGYWEKNSIVDLNDELLAIFDSAWDHVPAFADDWQVRPRVIARRARARQIVDSLAAAADQGEWGWKDPRNSVLLPFWNDVIGDQLRVVCCVRNPVEVAISLERRNGFSRQHSYYLWWRYNQAVLDATSADQRVVTHYEAYAHDAAGELGRVCEALGLRADASRIDAAAAHHQPGLRHHHVSAATAIDEGIPEHIIGTYLRLCGEAGDATRARISGELQSCDRLPQLESAHEATALARDLYELRLETYVHRLEQQLQSCQ